jgi:hypothetical protein
MSNLLLDIVTYLTTEGLVTGDGVDAFRDFTPEEPNAVVSVHEYKGSPPPLFETISTRMVQVAVRDVSSTAARNKALDLYNALHSPDTYLDLTASRWALIQPMNTPTKIRVDKQSRVFYGFNLSITTQHD